VRIGRMANLADWRTRKQNTEILLALIKRSETQMRNQARFHCRLPDDAEEALQRSYILFIERFDPSRFSPLPWMLTTIKHEAWGIARLSHRRHEIGFTEVPRGDGGTSDLAEFFTDPVPGPAERALELSASEERRAALERLKPDERTALIMIGLGCSYAEIAERRGWTLTKVNRCAAEGRKAARRLVAKQWR
jgi:DNA-directed RNA polymerase specialized sigma24 family protein